MNRIRALDICRGLLICLVVAGHLAGMSAHWSNELGRRISETLFALIYSFHMPAFFLLAGLTSKSVMDLKAYCRKKMRRLLVPYLAFGIFSSLVYLGIRSYFGSAAGGAGDTYYDAKGMDCWWHSFASLIYGAPIPGTDGFRCNSVLWFLPCLFTTQIIVAAVQRYILRTRLLRIIVYVLFLCVAYLFGLYKIDYLPWGLNVLPWYALYYFAGIEISQGWNNGIFAPKQLASVRFFVASAGVWCGLWLIIPNILFSRIEMHWFVPIVGCAILGTLATLSLSCMIDKWRRIDCVAECLCSIGVSSIGIMFLHKYPMMAFMLCVPNVKGLFASGLFGYATAFICVFIVSTMVSWCATIVLRRYIPIVLGED